jgi:hypothetical protein
LINLTNIEKTFYYLSMEKFNEDEAIKYKAISGG